MESAPDDFILTVPEDPAIRRLRWRRRFIIAGVLLVILLAGLSLRPTLHALKRWQARRLCAQAEIFLQQEEWQKAVNNVRQAANLQPGYPEVIRIQARLLTATGNFSPAEALWKRLVDLQTPLTTDDRRDYARTAIESNDFAVADDQIKILSGNHTAKDKLLAARLAERRSNFAGTVSLSLDALRASGVSERDRMDAAVLLLANSTQAAQRKEAWQVLDTIGTNQTALGLAALNFLATQETILLRGDSTLDTSVPIDPEQLGQRLDNHPLAKVAEHLRVYDLRIALRPSQRDQLLSAATKQFGHSDTEGLTALCLWLIRQQEPARVLEILPTSKAAQSKVLSVTRVESLAALERWNELESELDNPDSDLKLEELTAELYLARCAAKLDKKAALQNRWDHAFELAAGDSSKFLLVGGEAEHDGFLERAETAYRSAIKAQPGERRAYDNLLRLTAKKSSLAAYETLAVMAKQWPGDPNIHNSKIYAGLLSAQLAPAQARAEAEALVRQVPLDSSFRATYALSLLKLGRSKEALEAFGEVSPELSTGRARVSTAAVHAAVLSANGQDAQAREEAARIPLNALAREEQALIAPLLTPRA